MRYIPSVKSNTPILDDVYNGEDSRDILCILQKRNSDPAHLEDPQWRHARWVRKQNRNNTGLTISEPQFLQATRKGIAPSSERH